MLNLLPAMREIDKKRDAAQREFDIKMGSLNEAYKVLFDLNEACPHCDGKGKKLRQRACAEDDRPNPNDPTDWETCQHCRGTGKIIKRVNRTDEMKGEVVFD